jgi:hypothetical protein
MVLAMLKIQMKLPQLLGLFMAFTVGSVYISQLLGWNQILYIVSL